MENHRIYILYFCFQYPYSPADRGGRIIPYISITNPNTNNTGANVILRMLYTSFASNTLGSGLFPPAIRNRDSAITIAPIAIHL